MDQEWEHQRDGVKEKYDSTHTDQQLKKQRKNQQLEQILKDLEDESLLLHNRAPATVTESSSDTEATCHHSLKSMRKRKAAIDTSIDSASDQLQAAKITRVVLLREKNAVQSRNKNKSPEHAQ